MRRQLLHHRIVDGIRRACQEGLARHAQETAFAFRPSECPPAGVAHGRLQRADRARPHRSAHHEDARVPQIFAAVHILPRGRRIRFFHEGVQCETTVALRHRIATPEIAVAGFRTRRDHAESDESALACIRQRLGDGFTEPAFDRRSRDPQASPARSESAPSLSATAAASVSAGAVFLPAGSSTCRASSMSTLRSCSATMKRYSSLPTTSGVRSVAAVKPSRRRAVACSIERSPVRGNNCFG